MKQSNIYLTMSSTALLCALWILRDTRVSHHWGAQVIIFSLAGFIFLGASIYEEMRNR